MLDDDFFELDEDLLNATDFSKKFDETGSLDYSADIGTIAYPIHSIEL